jgi:hypothetical protein
MGAEGFWHIQGGLKLGHPREIWVFRQKSTGLCVYGEQSISWEIAAEASQAVFSLLSALLSYPARQVSISRLTDKILTPPKPTIYSGLTKLMHGRNYSIYSPLSDCARYPDIIITCRESSLAEWNSLTKPSVRRPRGFHLKGFCGHMNGHLLAVHCPGFIAWACLDSSLSRNEWMNLLEFCSTSSAPPLT